jgi:uncharacterized protein (TIGR02757 family)
LNKEALDDLYDTYNRREFVHPDPLEFLYRYDDVRDREIVGLVASSLAFGRVEQILASLERVLEPLGPEPARFLAGTSPGSLRSIFAGFRHRFAGAEDLCRLLCGTREILRCYGSIEACFGSKCQDGEETVLPALSGLVDELWACGARGSKLLPSPRGGSACKRLNLYLRWMVRRDEVDPGGWEGVGASKLVIPLDTHMYGFSRTLGLTRRCRADIRSALEVTSAFREIAPHDPVRYDFCLTRLGIRGEPIGAEFLARCGASRLG